MFAFCKRRERQNRALSQHNRTNTHGYRGERHMSSIQAMDEIRRECRRLLPRINLEKVGHHAQGLNKTHTLSWPVGVGDEDRLDTGHDLLSNDLSVWLDDRETQRSRPNHAGHLLLLRPSDAHLRSSDSFDGLWFNVLLLGSDIF